MSYGTQQESQNYADPQLGSQTGWTYNGVTYDNLVDYFAAQAEDMTSSGAFYGTEPGGRPAATYSEASPWNQLYDQWVNMQSLPYSFDSPNPFNFLSWENFLDAEFTTSPEGSILPTSTFDFTDVDVRKPYRPSGGASLIDYLIPSQLMTDIMATRETPASLTDEFMKSQLSLWDTYTPEQKESARQDTFEAYKDEMNLSNIWSQEGVLRGMENIGQKYMTGDWGEKTPLSPESVRAFKPSDFEKLKPGYYTTSILEPGREALETQLGGRLGQAATMGKGIAGYGRRGAMGEAAKGAYGRGVEDLYSAVDTARSGALQDIYDILGEWEGMSETYGG